MKKTIVIEIKPRIGTDCKMSNIGMSTSSARRLFAAAAAYVNVNSSDNSIAASMRNVVRAAYSGR